MKQEKPLITRLVPLLLIFVVFFAMITSSVAARYVKQSENVVNTFVPATSVIPEVKKDGTIYVGETEYPVFVRATIVVTWQSVDEKGNQIVYYDPPTASDYTLTLNLTATGWTQGGDGYFYYKKSVASDGSTTALIKSCVQSDDANVPDGYTLNVELIVQTVQAVGITDDGKTDAYLDAWENAPALA